MIDGGLIAKKGYRYQDMCAAYFALKSYNKDTSTFEQIYCEQDKLDFEIWKTDLFSGYQVKNQKTMLSANEVNTILKYYLKKSSDSAKDTNKFWFIFSHKPKNSFSQLLLKLVGSGGVGYHKRTQKYIDTALDGIAVNTMDLSVDHYCYSYDEIEDMLFGTTRRVIKNYLGTTRDVNTTVVENLLKCILDDIDAISAKDDQDMRFYSYKNIDDSIKNYMSNIVIQDYSDEGERSDKSVGAPYRTPVMRLGLIPQSSARTQVEGEVIKE